MSRGVMTEVIVDIANKSVRDERFVEWLWGWLGTRYVLRGAYLRENMTEVAFVLEKDVFTLFAEMYRVVSYMRSRLRSKVPVALCSGDECIEMSDTYYLVLMSEYKIRKLRKVLRMVEQMARKEEVRSISIIGLSGQVWIDIGCGTTVLYTDEVVALIGLLLNKLYEMTELVVFKEARNHVYSVVNPFAVDYSVVDLEVKICCEELIDIILDGCKEGFTYKEALWIVSKLLSIVIDDLKDARKWMKIDYGVEV
jgi:hypothetical protein